MSALLTKGLEKEINAMFIIGFSPQGTLGGDSEFMGPHQMYSLTHKKRQQFRMACDHMT